MKKLYPHQQKFKDSCKPRELLAWSVGTGKTTAAVEWLVKYGGNNPLVLCPKRIVRNWGKELGDVKASVMSYEQFKKLGFRNPTALVLDEASNFYSPLFIPSLRSQRTEAVYDLIKQTPSIPILQLDAVPVRSAPHNFHTALTFLGVHIDWKKYQAHFYELQRRPYLPRPAWIAKPQWRKMIAPLIKKYANIVTLHDCVESVPLFEEIVVKVRSPKFTPTEWEPMAAVVEEHRHENGIHKVKNIQEIGNGHRKVMVVCHYVEQIKQYEKELSGERPVFMIHGGVKDQEAVIEEANQAEDCYFLVQASLSAGFNASTFECVVFASMSYRAVDWVQMKGRITRINNLHPVRYYYLLGGRIDKAVYETIQKSKDFIPAEFANKKKI